MRRVKIDHKNPPRYKDLTEESKRRHVMYSRFIIEYAKKNPNTLITWEQIDKCIPHLYSFVIEDYNNSHQNTKIIINDEGLYLKNTRTN